MTKRELILGRTLILAASVVTAVACGPSEYTLTAANADGDHPHLFAGEEDEVESFLTYEGSGVRMSRPIDVAGTRFNRIGLRFDAELTPEAEVRFSRDGEQTWSEWKPFEITFKEQVAHNAFAEADMDSTHLQLRFKSESDTKIRFLFIQLVDSLTPNSEPVEIGVELNELEQGLGVSGVILRPQWGAPAACCGGGHRPNRLTVHHTVTPNNDSLSGEARMRQMRSFHIYNNGWCDIGYHYAIGQDGRVFQGRPARQIGAHVGGYNANNVGIALMGSYHLNEVPPPAQMASTVRVLAESAREFGIALDRHHVFGHTELKAKDCPGRQMLSRLSAVVDQARLGAGGGLVQGAILVKYLSIGGAGSIIGRPLTPELPTPDGVGRYNHFEHGSIYWHPATGAYVVLGEIRKKWEQYRWEAGHLGYPVTDELPTPDGRGRFNHFTGGSIYFWPEIGARAVWGNIRHKWAEMGWERSILGYPVTDELGTPDGVGRYNHFERGSIYYHPAAGTHWIWGEIRNKWAAQGWETGPLGYPVMDETPNPDGIGRFQHFQNGGSIYWTPNLGAYIVRGEIRKKWEQLHWEVGPLGYPTKDYSTTKDGVGRYGYFQNGYVYWHPKYGANAVLGEIAKKWAETNFEQGPLGYPISDEMKVANDGKRVNFENGHILWTKTEGAVVKLK